MVEMLAHPNKHKKINALHPSLFVQFLRKSLAVLFLCIVISPISDDLQYQSRTAYLTFP